MIQFLSFFNKPGFLFRMALISFVLFMLACEPIKEETESDKFEKELNSFNDRMDNIGQSLEILDAMQHELDELEKQRATGEIDDVTYGKRTNEIKNTYGRAIARRDKPAQVNGLPQWAIELGLTEPNGLTLDQEFSQITAANNPNEGFNSVLMVYTGDYETAMQEAQRIANTARIPLSRDFEEALEITKKFGSTPLRGIAYMNFEPFVKDAPINISITVDESGMLTISAVNVDQMSRQFERRSNTE